MKNKIINISSENRAKDQQSSQEKIDSEIIVIRNMIN